MGAILGAKSLVKCNLKNEAKKGDYSCNVAFKLAKKLNRSVEDIANLIITNTIDWGSPVGRVKNVKGHINIYLVQMSYYRQQLEEYLSKLDIKADKVLDIGGSSLPVKNRVKNFEVGEYLILDNCAEEEYEDSFIKPDIEADINEPIYKLATGYNFNIIFCLEVAEYFYDPFTAIANIREFVTVGGILYITFPTIYPVHNPKEIDYMRYTKQGVIKLLSENEFEILGLIPRKTKLGGEKALKKFWKIDGMHPVKHDDSIYDTGYIVEAKKL